MFKDLIPFRRDRTRHPLFTAEDRENIMWFWNGYLKKRTIWLVAVLGLIFLQGIAYQQFLSLTEKGLRVIFDNGAVTDLIRVCAIVFGLFALRGTASYVVPRLSTWLASGAVMEMRRDMIDHLMTFDLAHFEMTPPGDYILKLVQQAQTLSQFVGQATISAVRDFFTVIIVSGYLIYKAPFLFFTALIVAPVILFVLQRTSNGIKEVQRKSESALGGYMNALEETLSGMRTVKISNQERFERERLTVSTEKIHDLQIRLQAAQAIVLPAIDLASAFAYSLVIGVGGYMAIASEHRIDGATIITFLIGLVMVFDPLRNLARFFTTLQSRLVILRSVNRLLNIRPTITDAPGAVAEFDTKGDIRFEDVTFSYAADTELFQNLSMHFTGGHRTAIVGATGSGKTTVLSLLGRLYEVEAGQITIGGTNIRDIQVNALRQSFSVVAQDIVIFNASIFENIRYVRPDATDAEIWEAAENAEIADLMRARGEAKVGPKGAQLSGGQKQRIAIARAFLRSAPILLLDEATSALDQRTEEKVKRALKRLSEGKTTLIVAHRLSAIVDVDRIYVLDAGRVVETGSHDELLQQQGLYAGMYTTQKSEYL
ncbi:MAG: ABC transporter ATP-binding protein [Rhodobacteraceae bacterium]|nr:ABC transporter ATP-binding protein [Paracoccaceae bacterium]